MPQRKIFTKCFFVITCLLISAFQVFPQTSVSYLTEPSISPDNKEIAFVSGGDIWTVSTSGGTAQILVSHEATEGRPVYSPDGKKLAFTSNRSGNMDIYVLDFATNNLTRVLITILPTILMRGRGTANGFIFIRRIRIFSG